MFQNAGQCAVGHYAAAADEDNPGGDGFRFFQQMGGNQDGFVFPHTGDQFADMGFLIGVEAVGRFVEEQYGRIA